MFYYYGIIFEANLTNLILRTKQLRSCKRVAIKTEQISYTVKPCNRIFYTIVIVYKVHFSGGWWLKNLGVADGLDAVSYTHLDVYKRQ